MTIVVSNKQRIYYRFEGDKGAYLLLHHGTFGSHRDWYDAGYVEALRDEFRLIVLDARGHGRSDHPLEPAAYRLADFADDVIALMNELDIRNLHFCGYSLGALVGFELLLRYPERMRIVMLAGESPFVSESMQADWRRQAETIRQDGLAAVRERLRAENRLVAAALAPEPFAPEQEGEQAAALALLEGLAATPPRPDDGRISVNSPVALFTGEDDPALGRMRDARRRIHRARFVSFPGQSHAGLFRERNALTGEILRLLRPGRRPGEGGEGEGAGGEGRRRGERGQERRPQPGEGERLPSAPLTPPPPVDVQARSEPGTGGAAPPAGEPVRDTWGEPPAVSSPGEIAQPFAAGETLESAQPGEVSLGPLQPTQPPQDARTLPPQPGIDSGSALGALAEPVPQAGSDAGNVPGAAGSPADEAPALPTPDELGLRAHPDEEALPQPAAWEEAPPERGWEDVAPAWEPLESDPAGPVDAALAPTDAPDVSAVPDGGDTRHAEPEAADFQVGSEAGRETDGEAVGEAVGDADSEADLDAADGTEPDRP